MKLRDLALLALAATCLLTACKKDKQTPTPGPTPTDPTPEGYVYYSSHDTIYRVKATGGTPQMLFNGTDDGNGVFKSKSIDDIVIDPTSGKLIFLTRTQEASWNSNIAFAGQRDGSGALTKIADGKINGTFGNTSSRVSFMGMTAANGKVYMQCNDSFVGVVNIDGTGATKLYEAFSQHNDSWLYADLTVDPTTNTLYSLGDTAVWKVGLAPNSTPANIASNKTQDDTFNGYQMILRKSTEELFFIADNDDNLDIYKVKTNGTGYTKLYSLENYSYNPSIAVDEGNGNLYAPIGNTIYQIKPNGSQMAVTRANSLRAIAYY